MTTLLAWLLGDTYKSVHGYYHQLLSHTHLYINRCLYFFLQGSPLQFKACSVFQLSVDCSMSTHQSPGALKHLRSYPVIVMQRIYYGNPPPAEVLPPDEDVEAALRLDSDLEEPPSR
jgi:hypothetical protein